MRLLVTGGLGAIGCMVLGRLVREGHEAIVFDQRDYRSLIPDIAEDLVIDVGDVRDWAGLARVVRRYDPVVAAYPHTGLNTPSAT